MTIKTFDTAADMQAFFERTQRDRVEMDRCVQPFQIALKPGDYCFRVWRTEWPPFAIFMQVLAPDNAHDKYLMRERPNSRIIRAWSQKTDDRGEVGTVHVAQIWGALDTEDFQEAKRDGWRLPIRLIDRFRWAFEQPMPEP